MQTNYERIKTMSIEEMAEFVNSCFCTSSGDFISCKTCFIRKLCDEMNRDYMYTETDRKKIKKWLESRAKK